MVPNCFVDGDIADWQSDYDTFIGCDIQAMIIYYPEMTRREFERACDWLEERAEERLHILLSLARPDGRRLGVVDNRLQELADELVSKEFGDNFLERFIRDSLKVAHDNLGAVMSCRNRVLLTPSCVRDTVEVTPAKSFRTEKSLASYLRDGRSTWKPSVRMTFAVTIEGPWGEVESMAAALRYALNECGPVAEWRQRVRAASEREAVPQKVLRIVASNQT